MFAAITIVLLLSPVLLSPVLIAAIRYKSGNVQRFDFYFLVSGFVLAILYIIASYLTL